MPHLRLALGLAVAAALGSSVLPAWRARSLSRFALDLAVGLAIAVPTILILGLLLLPLYPKWIVAWEALLIALFLFWRRRWPQDLAASEPVEPPRTGGLSGFVFGVSFLVAAGKWLRVPLWSFDHFAMWGIKARRIVQDGALDLGFLQLSSLRYTAVEYPIGLPLSWRVLSLHRPDDTIFRIAHAVFALALALLVRRTVLRASGSWRVANTMAAFLCVSPLYWNTEAVGLADLPLALFVVASVALLLEARDRRAPAWVAGITIGFVSWIKKEGSLLSLLLLALGLILLWRESKRGSRVARLAGLGLPALLLMSATFLITWHLLPRGVEFFAEDWRGRAYQRLREPGKILSALGHELLRIEWWGIWLLFALVFGYCLLARKPVAALTLGIVLAALGTYAVVYFVTYLDPLEHIDHSFFRIAAALVPLGLVGISFAFEPAFRDSR